MMKTSVSQLEAAAMVELNERKRMAVRLFRPQPHQDRIFQMPRSKYMLIQGGNRSGKSTTAAVLFAAIATDTPITLSDGTEIDVREPWQKGKCLRMWVVGYHEKHIGQTIHRLLFQKGLFKVVTDPKTKALRARNPDTDSKIKPKDSPPLIPGRYVRGFSWVTRTENIFSKVVIKSPVTGEDIAEIYAFSSMGIPKAGDNCDVVWLDESLAKEGYIDEMKARLVDNDGQLFWSSWPDSDSEDLLKFSAMLDKEIDLGNHSTARKVVLTMSGNRHLSQKSVQEFLAGCSSIEEAEARDKGIFVTDSLRMFPLFQKDLHTAVLSNLGGTPRNDEDELSRFLRARDGIPPNDWTKYLILDPGTNNPAVLLCAVPPPEFGEYFIPYMEFYPGRMDATQLAKHVWEFAFKEKFYRFIIDKHAGRQTPMGFNSRIQDAYEQAFQAQGFSCYRSKGRFDQGCDDVGGRQMIINSWMHNGPRGLPKLRIVTHRCPKLCEQIQKVKKKVIQKEVKDERIQEGTPHDLTDALGYFAGSHPRYVYVKPTIEDASPAYQRYMKRFGNGSDQQKSISIGTFY